MSDEKRKQTETEYPQLQLSSQLCFPLYACARKVISAYTPLLKPFGLTYTQYIVLLALWEDEGKEKVGDVCHKLYLDCGTMTPMLKKMEENGWITRSRSREDERVGTVALTQQGWALRDQVTEVPQKVGSCIRLEPEEAMTLHRILYRLLDQE